MRLNDVCRKLLAEHDRLKQLALALESAALEARCGGSIERVRRSAEALARLFLVHVEHEENLLGPHLTSTAAARRMLEEHDRQRVGVKRLLEMAALGSPGELLRASRSFCAALLEDMAAEEAELFCTSRNAPRAER